MLPDEQIDKWVAALRSGEYKQGRGQLYVPKENSYCCLGVLGCVVHGLKPTTLGGRFYLGALPHDVENTIAEMNDEQEMNFSEIADWIDANLRSKADAASAPQAD